MEVKAPITANVWKVLVQKGQKVSSGEIMVILESMKMEIPVEAPCSGIVKEIFVEEGGSIIEGEKVAEVECG